MRHTALTNLVAGGINIRLTQDIAGHTSIVTTSRYAHIVDEQRRKVADLLDSRRGPTAEAAD
jgi:site-specific recombinase XerD